MTPASECRTFPAIRQENEMNATSITRRHFVAGCLATASTAALAQADYPSRPVRIVVPVPPGGFADTLPRLVAEKLASRWNQSVIIENRPGAGLNIGAEAVAKAAPDGYTLLATPPGPLAVNQALYAKLGYDPAAFVPISILATGPFVLVVRRTLPVSSLPELIAYAKANPGKLNYGSSGVGSNPHIAAEMLKAKAGISLVHVPYKGQTPALMDLIAGHVDVLFHDVASVTSPVREGQVRLLGTGGDAPVPEFPDAPPIAKFLPGFGVSAWYAVVAPPKTPAVISAKVSQAIAEALRTSDVAGKLREISISPVGSTPEETAVFLKQEAERYRQVIVAAGIKAE
jgi:tripartite-type tricarboxylate transporter receptor subunit TctC